MPMTAASSNPILRRGLAFPPGRTSLTQAGVREGQPGEEAMGGVQLEVRRFLGGMLRSDHRLQPIRDV